MILPAVGIRSLVSARARQGGREVSVVAAREMMRLWHWQKWTRAVPSLRRAADQSNLIESHRIGQSTPIWQSAGQSAHSSGILPSLWSTVPGGRQLAHANISHECGLVQRQVGTRREYEYYAQSRDGLRDARTTCERHDGGTGVGGCVAQGAAESRVLPNR